MKWINRTALAAAALGIVALLTTEASAQTAPTLTVTTSGVTVTIDWTGVPGATGYNLVVGSTPGGSNIASVNLPASITHIVVAAPPGAYFLRVRATAGALTGPFSNEGAANVGITPPPPPCNSAPAAPSVTATPQGANVQVSWNAVDGAQGYRVEFARTPGGTEMAQTFNAAITTYTTYVGALGTYYVRVIAGNTCGQTASATIAFTITDLSSGGGPRTPDPAPGQLLPMPTYAGDVVRDIARRYPADLAAHSGGNCKNQNTWLFKLLRELRLRDSRWGLNWKRGWPGTFSTDIVTYNPTDGPDITATHIYLADVLSGECESNIPVFNWEAVTQETWRADRNNPGLCANRDCAAWTIVPYLAAGFPADQRPQQ